MLQVAPALAAVLAILAAAGCGRGQSRKAAVITAAEPSLWEVTAFDSAGRPEESVRICADDRIQAGFSRPTPVVGDQTCGAIQVVQERPGAYSATCRIGQEPFAVNAAVSGDQTRDFKVEINVQPLPAGPVFQQVRTYRKVAEACPPGWTVGVASKPSRPGPYASAPGEAANPVVRGGPAPTGAGRPGGLTP